jgi:hypothetical protein
VPIYRFAIGDTEEFKFEITARIEAKTLSAARKRLVEILPQDVDIDVQADLGPNESVTLYCRSGEEMFKRLGLLSEAVCPECDDTHPITSDSDLILCRDCFAKYAEGRSAPALAPRFALHQAVEKIWTVGDANKADAEGWSLFDAGGRFEIERDDETEIFDSDEAAVAHVERRAAEGSTLHAKALLIHRAFEQRSTEEAAINE